MKGRKETGVSCRWVLYSWEEMSSPGKFVPLMGLLEGGKSPLTYSGASGATHQKGEWNCNHVKKIIIIKHTVRTVYSLNVTACVKRVVTTCGLEG